MRSSMQACRCGAALQLVHCTGVCSNPHQLGFPPPTVYPQIVLGNFFCARYWSLIALLILTLILIQVMNCPRFFNVVSLPRCNQAVFKFDDPPQQRGGGLPKPFTRGSFEFPSAGYPPAEVSKMSLIFQLLFSAPRGPTPLGWWDPRP